MPIFKELFKSCCDQGYVCYKRICELREAARVQEVKAAEVKATNDAIEAAKRAAGDAPIDEAALKAVGTLAAASVPKGTVIEPMPHLDFLEAIAEGFVIEAYNSTKKHQAQHMSLYDYDLPRLERALEELRGDKPPSHAATGARPRDVGIAPVTPTTTHTVSKGVKRRIEADEDGRLPESKLDSQEKHPLISGEDAVRLNLISEGYRKTSMYCAYKHCPIAAKNAESKCGTASKNVEAPRAKCQCYCPHPACKRAYHPWCYSVVHRLTEP
ncbi:hypothetical protein AB1Y20_016676 [Prymnesium parvum]|uniref:Uncharacterized protein n=1 Tax=Prymnesium parvum TaxID=97485 RepID=A0AB34IDF4_PRYPA